MERKRDITNHKESLQGYLKIIKEYRWMIAYLAVIIIIIEILRLAPKYLLGYIVDQGALFTSGDIAQSVLIYSFWIAFYVFVTVTVLRIIFTYIREVKSMVLFIEMTRNVKKKFFNHLISLDAEFHNTTKTGSIISRLSRGSNAVQGLSLIHI